MAWQADWVFIQGRRYRCTRCGKTLLEPVADFDGKRQATDRLLRYIREQSFRKTYATLRFRMSRILSIELRASANIGP